MNNGIMRHEKTKISRRRSKTSEDIVTAQSHTLPNDIYHHYASKIKIRKRKKKNELKM